MLGKHIFYFFKIVMSNFVFALFGYNGSVVCF